MTESLFDTNFTEQAPAQASSQPAPGSAGPPPSSSQPAPASSLAGAPHQSSLPPGAHPPYDDSPHGSHGSHGSSHGSAASGYYAASGPASMLPSQSAPPGIAPLGLGSSQLGARTLPTHLQGSQLVPPNALAFAMALPLASQLLVLPVSPLPPLSSHLPLAPVDALGGAALASPLPGTSPLPGASPLPSSSLPPSPLPELSTDNSPQPLLAQLPDVADPTHAAALIVFRVLVLAKEAGCLIGQNGQVIDSIRTQTKTRAGISRLQPGSHERILTVLGTLDAAAKALSFFAQALVNLGPAPAEYSYFPLKQLLLTPCVDGETTVLRLLVPNKQMGTLIGAKGARIQQIQHRYLVLMIALKLFLPGSNERLVELQGSVNNLYDALKVIARCLIEDFSLIVGTNYYEPRGLARPGPKPATNGAEPQQLAAKITLSFPNGIVGALIGKNGLRIQGVRKVLGAYIGISDEEEGKDEREFIITGSHQAVVKAKEMLYHNLHREEQRRAMA